MLLKKEYLQKIQNHPAKKGNFLELATIEYPAYLYNTSNANIILTDNRRYTMRDIGIIEDRVENLERVTTLISYSKIILQTLREYKILKVEIDLRVDFLLMIFLTVLEFDTFLNQQH